MQNATTAASAASHVPHLRGRAGSNLSTLKRDFDIRVVVACDGARNASASAPVLKNHNASAAVGSALSCTSCGLSAAMRAAISSLPSRSCSASRIRPILITNDDDFGCGLPAESALLCARTAARRWPGKELMYPSDSNFAGGVTGIAASGLPP